MNTGLSWLGVARLGLAQAMLGAVVVLTTSTLNRVMVVELALPALLPGLLVALHYAVQLSRPRMGFGADRSQRRTRWILGGLAVLAAGGWLAAVAVAWISTWPTAGMALAAVAFAVVGVGVSAAGTNLLTLLATQVAPERRAGAAAMVWTMMIFGFAVTAGLAGRWLDPYTPARLIMVSGWVSLTAMAVATLALWRLEREPMRNTGGEQAAMNVQRFRAALAEVWAETEARQFTVFVFVSMVAYSAQDLILEPFAGLMFGYSPGESTQLSGVQHGGTLAGMLLAGLAGRRFGGVGLGSLKVWTVGGCLASCLALLGLALAGVGSLAQWPLRANVFVLGVANGAFSIAAIGSMMALAGGGVGQRSAREGTRMGLWGAAQAIGFAGGGLIGAAASDALRWLWGSPGLAYAGVFAAEALLFVLAARIAAGLAAAPRANAGGVSEGVAMKTQHDVIVVGGGPSGATAAHELARQGYRVLLIERGGRIKPCGGAIPPRLIADFDIPAHLLVARARSARMVSPSDVRVDIPIEGGFVGMVDREAFDEWLRERAALAGAQRVQGRFTQLTQLTQLSQLSQLSQQADGRVRVQWTQDEQACEATARCVIGADGARSAVAHQAVAEFDRGRYVFAYHEVVQKPQTPDALPPGYDPTRCDVIYRGTLSPDFYAWVFPHGDTLSIGTGSADKGFSLRGSVTALRQQLGFSAARTLRKEGAPIPLKPLPRWDNGRNVVLVGDAAGVVAPASGEGIYYAMASARMAAEAVSLFLATGRAHHLASVRKRFMREHGRVFWVLGVMQHFWYRNDKRRERFVSICRDRDVQQLTFDAYMHKRLVRAKPMAHVRIFFKDLAHLMGWARV